MKRTECNHWLGCNFPNCYCQVDDPAKPKNQFKDKVDVVASELQRVSRALSQFKIELIEAELSNDVILAGLQQAITKYTDEGKSTANVTLKLAYSNFIKDIENIIKVSQQSAADIVSKTTT
jgi:hypothetical protein